MNRRPVFMAIIGAGVGLLITITVSAGIIAASTVLNVRQTQQTNSPVIESTSRTLKILRDCTTPGRRCYDQAVAAQAARQGADLTAAIASVWCGLKLSANGEVPTYRELAVCVGKRLDGSKGTTP